jgi:H+/Cl- antiporter ClcA
LLIGICSVWWPELPGNGKSILTVSLASGLTLGSAVVILCLKPLLTAVFLRTGAVGGMLTPALATGAAMGSVVAIAINTWTQHAVSVPAVSLTCAAGVLAITQRAPIWAAIFVWELARPPWWLLVVFLVAASSAHGLRVLRERRSSEMITARS